MNVPSTLPRSVLATCLVAVAVSQVAMAKDADISQTPLFVSNAAPPLNMLVMGRDHKLYYEAYNDASDLNGDGMIDVGYKGHLPLGRGGIDYYGYFDSHRCYTYDQGSRQFDPADAAPNKTCDGKTWSGDFLNYLTTSRIDAMRKVFYGGYRVVDSEKETVLERSYIPQDAHSWGKEYTSTAVDGYDIQLYTPLNQPAGNTRHLFANTTLDSDASWGPRLRLLKDSRFRIWEWVSKENPVADWQCNTSWCGNITDYRVRVSVCQSEKLDDNCTLYPNGSYKPTGILHDYGATDKMYFGLLTGSYANNTQGGVIRSNIESFSREFNPKTGQFCLNGKCGKDGDVKGIIDTLNRLKYTGSGCGWIVDRPIKNGECEMWGNPVAEMMYEALRYYAGANNPISLYDYKSSGKDIELGLPKPEWISPYKIKEEGGSGYLSCSIPAMTVISDINPSYDFALPGSHWLKEKETKENQGDGKDVFTPPSGEPNSIKDLSVSAEVDAIWNAEENKPAQIFIGESNNVSESAPTPKKFTNFSTVRGLAPEEPTKQGTYYSAGISRFGALHPISGKKNLTTYSVALASPLPKIEIPIGNQTVTLIPFAKSVAGGGVKTKETDHETGEVKEFAFQPTDQIVDYYVQKIANMAANGSDADSNVNGGRPYAEFRINFEDVEQGADHDMDMITLYTLAVTPDNKLKVKLYSEYAFGAQQQHAGYIISGTTADGIYLEVCDLANDKTNDGQRSTSCDTGSNTAYKLNTPPGRPAGWCAIGNNIGTKECAELPPIAERIFSPGDSRGAKLLKSPLWYAAKYGDPKTVEHNGDDSDKDPSNYFLVTNPLVLKQQLNKAFSDIVQEAASVSRPSVMPEGPKLEDKRSVYKTSFEAKGWIGDLIKVTQDPTTGAESAPEWHAQIPANRSIMMAGRNGLVAFDWKNLSDEQKAALDKNPAGVSDGKGEMRVEFIKGDRSQEGKLFRIRKSLLGDIVNSGPVTVAGAYYLAYMADNIEGNESNYNQFKEEQAKRRKQIYVGANDGMLHAFDASKGKETFAFVPSAVIGHLNQLTGTEYTHRYYVDGTLTIRDVYFKKAWHTVLIGTLRAGGRSLFALDITDPDKIELLWEFNEDNPATLDADTRLSDLGYSFATPEIVRLHSGQWAALVGNGYNSANSSSGKAVLFALDIKTGEVIAKLVAQGTKNVNNGLSSVRAADLDGDNVADYAYAGDLQGNLWRFDLLSASRSEEAPFSRSTDGAGVAKQFAVSFSGTPLYKATTPDGTAQPITTQPSLVRHPSYRGYLVLFGTGRYLGESDKTDKSLQTVYGIWDTQTRGETASSTHSLNRSDLQEQTFELQTNATFGAISRDIRLLSDNPVDWIDSDGNIKKWGWYLDLKVKGQNAIGERVVDNMTARGQVLFLSTRTPVDDPCEAGLSGRINGIDPFTGGRTRFNVFDLNKSHTVDVSDSYTLNGKPVVVSSFDSGVGGFDLTGFILTEPNKSIGVNLGPNSTGRQSWQVVPTEQE
ncbi:pilus assembly protein [Pseudomonas indica]|uniref:pilus assembly protein n=1 Tax=Pseudomonas indica TaxID=137658 RepID=UPI003FD2F08A